jgi:hypothetical protein
MYNLITKLFLLIQRTKQWVGGCRKFVQKMAIEAELVLCIAAGAIEVYCIVRSL